MNSLLPASLWSVCIAVIIIKGCLCPLQGKSVFFFTCMWFSAVFMHIYQLLTCVHIYLYVYTHITPSVIASSVCMWVLSVSLSSFLPQFIPLALASCNWLCRKFLRTHCLFAWGFFSFILITELTNKWSCLSLLLAHSLHVRVLLPLKSNGFLLVNVSVLQRIGCFSLVDLGV